MKLERIMIVGGCRIDAEVNRLAASLADAARRLAWFERRYDDVEAIRRTGSEREIMLAEMEIALLFDRLKKECDSRMDT